MVPPATTGLGWSDGMRAAAVAGREGIAERVAAAIRFARAGAVAGNERTRRKDAGTRPRCHGEGSRANRNRKGFGGTLNEETPPGPKLAERSDFLRTPKSDPSPTGPGAPGRSSRRVASARRLRDRYRRNSRSGERSKAVGETNDHDGRPCRQRSPARLPSEAESNPASSGGGRRPPMDSSSSSGAQRPRRRRRSLLAAVPPVIVPVSMRRTPPRRLPPPHRRYSGSVARGGCSSAASLSASVRGCPGSSPCRIHSTTAF